VYTWGWNFNGQLGYDYKDEFRPRLLKPLLLIKVCPFSSHLTTSDVGLMQYN
jgi:alpha-tubulin suppressor-like RCC1 family protein